MSGIQALAAAAAATQKITGTTTTPSTSAIKVVTPTIVTPTGVKVTPIGNQVVKSKSTHTHVVLCIKYTDISLFDYLWSDGFDCCFPGQAIRLNWDRITDPLTKSD